MPRKVTAYACQFGCRHRVLTARKAMERHERTCLLNPARQTCATCKHDDYEWEGAEGDYGSGTMWKQPYCAEDRRPEGKACVINCPYWWKKESAIRKQQCEAAPIGDDGGKE